MFFWLRMVRSNWCNFLIVLFFIMFFNDFLYLFINFNLINCMFILVCVVIIRIRVFLFVLIFDNVFESF